MIRIDPKIAAHVDAALAAGFTVYALPDQLRPAGFVALCKDEAGSWAHIQRPSMALDPVQLDVPIEPNKDYGSGVHVDHDGTPEDAVRALTEACSKPMVTVRFMTRQYVAKHGTPVVPNYGRRCIEKWPGTGLFEKLGKRGTNWEVWLPASRLEVGDRFETRLEGRDHTDLTVTGRRYRGETVVLTVAELAEPVELGQRQFVTLLGGAA